MSLPTIQVSNNKVKVFKANEEDNIPVKGGDWFPHRYPNIFELAIKNSGKTTVIENILSRCSGKNTKFIIIVSTLNMDPIWKRIINKLKENNPVLALTDIYNDDGVNVIEQFIEDNKPKKEESDDEEEEDKSLNPIKERLPIKLANGKYLKQIQDLIPKKLKKKKRKPKIIIPDYIMVLDDLGNSMRDKAVTQLMKTNKHPKLMSIFSSQDLNDLAPAAIRQLDYVLVFGKMDQDKLINLYNRLSLSIGIDRFLQLYYDATSEPYQFLYISRCGEEEYRKGFTDKYPIKTMFNNV